MPTLEQLKKAFGKRFSQVDVTDTNPDKLMTDQSEEKELGDLKPTLPRKQKKVKFSK